MYIYIHIYIQQAPAMMRVWASPSATRVRKCENHICEPTFNSISQKWSRNF